jgi:hypothetical protein
VRPGCGDSTGVLPVESNGDPRERLVLDVKNAQTNSASSPAVGETFGKNDLVDEIPDPTAAREVLARLECHGLVGAMGGSGLLAALGLIRVVHDWDITTDGPPSSVEIALNEVGYPFRSGSAGGEGFATAALYVVDAASHKVDVIVGFALRSEGRTIDLPTRVTGSWRGLPLADPSVWEQAYRMMGQTAKADLLAAWLERADSSP